MGQQQQQQQQQRVVLWFRNDLRLTDNPTVHEAAQLVSRGLASEVGEVLATCMHHLMLLAATVAQHQGWTGTKCMPHHSLLAATMVQHTPENDVLCCGMQVVPLYCFDPRQFIATPWKNPKTGAVRAQFLLQSVRDLKSNLQRMGSDLVVHLGTPEDAIPGVLIVTCARP